MHQVKISTKLMTLLAAMALLVGGAGAETITVPNDQPTVHAAVAAASAGDVVFVLNGTYSITSAVNIPIAITLEGESEAGVIFDVDCGTGYGIHPSVGGVTLRNFTINVITQTGVRSGYAIHASGTPDVQDGLTLANVTVMGNSGGGTRRAGVDLHGYDNVLLSHVTSNDASYGNGIQLTGCRFVTVENCATANNAWGSLAVYCSQYLVPDRASSNVTIDGDSCTFSEGNVFIEDQFGLTCTDIVVTGYDYLMWNDEFRVGAPGFTFIKDTLADAVAHALIAFGGFEGATSIQEIATGDFLVDASLGIGLTIQAAVDAAEAGDVVNVAAGTYREQVIIDKSLSVLGAGAALTVVEAPDPVDRNPYQITTWTGSTRTVDPVIGVVAAGTVTVSDLTVDGRDTGPDNFYGVHFYDTSGVISGCTVAGIHHPAAPGAQRVLSIVATQSATTGPLVVDISDNVVPSFQKGGIAVQGPDLTFTVNRNQVSSNINPDIAGNGIQLSYGATGSTLENEVTGVGYSGDDWAGTGILLFECGDVTMNGDTVTGSQSGVNYSDWRWVYSHPVPVNLMLNDLNLDGNQWPLGAQLSGEQSDLNLTIVGGTIANSAADGIDVWGTADYPGYYTGWNNGNANVSITGLTVDGAGYDGLWVADLSGNATNAFDSFMVRESGFSGCVGNALNNQATETIDARLCWWGDAEGPTTVTRRAPATMVSRPVSMPTGLPDDARIRPIERPLSSDRAGDSVEGNVLFSGWLTDTPDAVGARPWLLGTSPAGGGIAPAVEVAIAGEAIDLLAGDYVLASQLVIDKDLTLGGAGQDLTVLAAGFNTPGGSYTTTASLIQIEAGVTAAIADLAIDGTGFNVRQAIQSQGDGLTVRRCEFSSIAAGAYDGRGIVFLTGTGLVEDCTMSTIQRIGVHVRGSAIPPAPAPVVTVDGLAYTGKGAGDFLDYGVEFGGGGQGQVDGSTITDCLGVASTDGSTSAGILVTDFYGTGTIATIADCTLTDNTTGLYVGYAEGDQSQASITGSLIADNASYGVYSAGPEVDALNNYWGTSSGPFHPATNPTGTGNEVSDHVLFNPWVGLPSASIGVTSTLINCDGTVTATVSLTVDENTEPVFGFGARMRASAELDWSNPQLVDPDLFGDDTIFMFEDMEDGSFLISGASTGGSPVYLDDPGTYPLFTVVFAAESEGVAEITFDSFIMRNPENQTTPVLFGSQQVTVDCTAPDAVTGITATPAHNKVNVSWTHDGSTVDHFEVYRAVWHNGTEGSSAYPEYDDLANDVIPARPLNRAAAAASEVWVLVDDDVDAGTTAILDASMADDRGVYYYEVYAIDLAANASANAPANDRATSYWLGDFSGDGYITPAADINTLADAFGTSTGHDSYNPIVDVGPTDDASRLGIPTTDNSIDFEDLMITALNFGVVTPGAKSDVTISDSVHLAWVQYSETRWALRLLDGQGLQGVRVRASLPEGGAITVTAGDLLDRQDGAHFLRAVGDGVDINLALLGTGRSFVGEGDLFVVDANVALVAEQLSIDARNLDNGGMAVELAQLTDVDLPEVFSLNANYPNPFNPATTIRFALPEGQPVRLTVYGIDGRLVATLVNGDFPAGNHEVTWHGRDAAGRLVASGTYMYRIDAGPYSAVRKMTLMK